MQRDKELFDIVADWIFSARVLPGYREILIRFGLGKVLLIIPPCSKSQYNETMRGEINSTRIIEIMRFQGEILHFINSNKEIILKYKL
jgi:hypothetical protein